MQIQKCELVLIHTFPVGEDNLVSECLKKEVRLLSFCAASIVTKILHIYTTYQTQRTVQWGNAIVTMEERELTSSVTRCLIGSNYFFLLMYKAEGGGGRVHCGSWKVYAGSLGIKSCGAEAVVSWEVNWDWVNVYLIKTRLAEQIDGFMPLENFLRLKPLWFLETHQIE